MDAQVETLVQGFRVGFDAISSSLADGEAKAGLTEIFRRIENLGESSPDFMSFSTKAAEENLFMKFSEASMKASAALQEQRKQEKQSGTSKKPTLSEYLNTYRGLLKMHRTKPHMEYTISAHEKFLDVAKDFGEDDIPGFLAEAERRGLNLPLAVSAVYDEWACSLRKLDPYDDILVEQYRNCAEHVLASRSGEDLDYRINREVTAMQRKLTGEEFRRLLRLRLVGAIQDYEMAKLSLFATGDFGKFLPGLLIARRTAKEWHEALAEYFGFDWDAHFAHPYHRKLATNFGFTIPDCMAVWESWHPDALIAMRSILFEEILPMPSLAQVAESKPAGIPATPLPEQKHQYGIDEKVAETARRLQPKALLPKGPAKPER